MPPAYNTLPFSDSTVLPHPSSRISGDTFDTCASALFNFHFLKIWAAHPVVCCRSPNSSVWMGAGKGGLVLQRFHSLLQIFMINFMLPVPTCSTGGNSHNWFLLEPTGVVGQPANQPPPGNLFCESLPAKCCTQGMEGTGHSPVWYTGQRCLSP